MQSLGEFWHHLRNGLGSLAVLTVAGAAMNFLGQGLLARMLDPAEFGRFGNALAQATLVAPLGGLGVYGLWLRVFSENGGEGGQAWLKPSLAAAVLATALLYLGFIWWGAWQGGGELLLFALMAAHIPARVAQELAGGAYQVDRRYTAYSLLQFWPYCARLPILILCAVLWPYFSNSRLLVFAGGHFIYSLLLIAVCAVALRNFGRAHSSKARIRPGLELSLTDVIAGGWPFLSSSILFALFAQAGIIVAAQVVGFHEAAVFIVANICASAGYLGVSIIYQRYWQPRLFRLVEDDPVHYAQFVTRAFGQSVIIGLVAVFSLSLVAWALLPYLFGREYQSAAPILQVLAIAVGLRCLNSHCSSTFVRTEDLSFRTRRQIYVMIVILPLMFLAASLLGVIGIAITSVAYEALLLAGFYPYARDAGQRELARQAQP